jgi:outer membrane biosynthesis protein TonB
MQSHRALRLVSPGAKSQYQPRSLCREPSIPGWHGKVTCGVKIDDQGHVRDVHVKGTTDESVIKRIRAALINWEYEPATTNGHPSLGFVQVNVE